LNKRILIFSTLILLAIASCAQDLNWRQLKKEGWKTFPTNYRTLKLEVKHLNRHASRLTSATAKAPTRQTAQLKAFWAAVYKECPEGCPVQTIGNVYREENGRIEVKTFIQKK